MRPKFPGPTVGPSARGRERAWWGQVDAQRRGTRSRCAGPRCGLHNSYFGSYTASSSSEIGIGALGTTSLMCVEPEGVMEQEAAFIAALQSATTYRVDGNSLELRDANQIATILSRVQ